MFALTAIGVPSGVIVRWEGSIATIPSGYVFCNGANGTTDLRDKFVIGAKQDDAGVPKSNVSGSLAQSGGSVTHTHTLNVNSDYALDGESATMTEVTDAVSHLPPWWAKAFIMKT